MRVDPQVKMIEIKLSQGAKPGHGGVLPGPKVTPEIAEARGVPVGVDCVSPASHSAFQHTGRDDAFHRAAAQALRRQAGGLQAVHRPPLGMVCIVKAMLATGITPDFIVVDGAEGGTGAAPLEFTDHVGAPLQEGCCWCTTRCAAWACATASAWAAPARWSAPSTSPA
jgi:glutamate synthase domain-containing protein 2